MKKLNKKGFTLVELIVVIVIIGILAAILIPNLGKWIEKARETQEQAAAVDVVKDYYAEAALQGLERETKVYYETEHYRFYFTNGAIDISENELITVDVDSNTTYKQLVKDTTNHKYTVGEAEIPYTE